MARYHSEIPSHQPAVHQHQPYMRSCTLPYFQQNISLKDILTLLHYPKMAQAPPPKRPIKVLMLHGFTQSGSLFHAKTRALEKNLQKAFPAGIQLSYPTAPMRLARADIPFPVNTNGEVKEGEEDEPDAWAWWRRKGDGEPYVYEGVEQGLDRLAEVLKSEGPFDGVIGFSQGGAMAAMLASLLEPNRRQAFEALYPSGGLSYPSSFTTKTGYIESALHAPLKFAVSYSGYAARGVESYRGFYEPKIATPMLHFLGTLDAVVDEAQSLALVDRCEKSEGRVVYHPGGHFLPSSQKAYVGALIGFMKEVLHEAEGEGKEEESAKDMDVPF